MSRILSFVSSFTGRRLTPAPERKNTRASSRVCSLAALRVAADAAFATGPTPVLFNSRTRIISVSSGVFAHELWLLVQLRTGKLQEVLKLRTTRLALAELCFHRADV